MGNSRPKRSLGTKLYATFLHSGLPAPNMTGATPVIGGPASPGYEQLLEHFVRALRSLLPMIERSGITNVAEMGIDTLAERLRESAVANDRVICMSRVVGARGATYVGDGRSFCRGSLLCTVNKDLIATRMSDRSR